MRTLPATLLATSAIGAVLFGSVFVLSRVRPVLVEKLAEKQVGEKLAALDTAWMGGIAKRKLTEGLASRRVAAVVAEMQDRLTAGLTYFAYLGVAVAFLADVVLNRARISTEVVNAACSAAGAAITAVPC